MSGARILVVEDEPAIARLLCDYLRAAGHVPEHLADGHAVIPAVRANAPDLILLDLMLPGRDGVSICAELRGFSDVPVIMLTARVEEVDRLIGLETGADDYVCKPFSPREVVARVKAILRRPRAAAAGDAVAPPTEPPKQGLHLDAERLIAWLDGQDLGLTPLEWRLLAALAAAPARVWSRDQLLDRLHDDQRALSDRAIDSHVKNLRRKLERVRPEADSIRSVYGVGYALAV